MNDTKQEVSIVWTLTLLVRMKDATVRVVLGAVRSVEIPVFFWASYIEKIVKHIFPPNQMTAPHNSQPVRILDIRDIPRELRDKDKV